MKALETKRPARVAGQVKIAAPPPSVAPIYAHYRPIHGGLSSTDYAPRHGFRIPPPDRGQSERGQSRAAALPKAKPRTITKALVIDAGGILAVLAFWLFLFLVLA